ncbi:MAG TPA: 1-pyrroline-5-carboxylate dehydrogenase, partial [Candidatus Hydrogenedentes bacterium]|nr:1-pyrroline-5-carboxylate dehydrogenase [Candidatus Hydrogenedentota bacterium]
MFNGFFSIPEPTNEPVLSYAPGTPERTELKARLQEMLDHPVEVASIIGGKEVRSGDVVEMRCPHNRSQVLGAYHRANAQHAEMAIAAANEAKREWSRM